MNALNYNSSCEQAEPYYYDFVCDESRQSVPDLIIEHIEQCPHCLQQIKQLKKILLEIEEQGESRQTQITASINEFLALHFFYIGKHVTCQTARLFLPGLLDPHLNIRIATPITVHLDNCAKCREDLQAIRKLNLNRYELWELVHMLTGQPAEDSLAEQPKMKKLKEIASQISKRPESGIVTTYKIDESANVRESNVGFPVSGEAIDSKDKADDKRPTINYRWMLKPAITAAAAILLVIGLFINTQTTGADTIEQIYMAIAKINNVYIAKFAPEKQDPNTKINNVYIAKFDVERKVPKQEKWVSRELNIYMTKASNEMVLWDIDNGLRKTKQLETGTIETNKLPERRIASIDRKISGSLGLMPFESISDIPSERGWGKVTNNYPQTAAEGLEVYDLTWETKAIDSSAVLKKWRFFIDTKTNLPRRTEFYQKLTTEEQYNLISVNVVEYLDTSEIQTALKVMEF